MSSRSRILIFLLSLGCLNACAVWMDVRTQELSKSYRFTENSMAYICTIELVPPRFRQSGDPKCLLRLDRELARPPQFPIGTPVKIVEIWEQKGLFFGDQNRGGMAKLRVGDASKPVYVIASWPDVLEVLEEVRPDGQ